MQDRPLPQSDEIEKYVIGCFLNMDDAQERIKKCAIMLAGADFYNPRYRRMMSNILQLLSNGRIVDIVNLSSLMREDSVELIEVSSTIVTTVLLEDRIADLKQYTARRKAICAGYDFLSGIYTSDDPLSLIRNIGEELKDFADSADLGNSKVEDATQVKSKYVKDGISSGFVTHDYNDSGLKGGCMTITTGFRGDGKTTVSRQMNMACAMQGIPVFNFIGESRSEEHTSELQSH